MVTLIRASGGGILGGLSSASPVASGIFSYTYDETGALTSSSAHSKKGNVGRAQRAMSITHARVYSQGAYGGTIDIVAIDPSNNDEITSVKGSKAVTTIADTWVEVEFDTPISIAVNEDFAIIFNRTDGAGTDSNGLYYKSGATTRVNKFFNWLRGWRNNNAGALNVTDINEASNSDPWLIQYRGSVTELETPASFILATAVNAPSGTNVSIAGFGQGENSDGEGGFVAPFDMTLKKFTEGNQRVGGYRTDTEYFIGINGDFTSLTGGSPVLAGTEDFRTYSPNVAIKMGDYVELTYTCSNNSSMTMQAAFYFEKDGTDQTTNGYGVIYYSGTASYNSTDDELGVAGTTRFSWGDWSVPQDITVVGIMGWPKDSTHGSFFDFHLFKNAVDQSIDFVLPSETEMGYKGGLNVSFTEGDLVKLQAVATERLEPYAMASLIYTVDGKTEADLSLHQLWLSDEDANIAADWWGPHYMPCDGRLTRANLIVPFGYANKDVYVSKNGATATTLFSVVDALDDIPYSVELNYTFSAGDYLQFSHDGQGTASGGLGLTLEIELDKTTELSNIPTAPVNTPSIASYTVTSEDNATRSTTGQLSSVTKPTGVTSGDLMWIVCVSSDVNATNNWTTPTGWTIAARGGNGQSDCEFTIFSRIADGTETDLNIGYSDDAEAVSAVWIRFSNARGLESWSGSVTDSSGTQGDQTSWDTLTDNALAIVLMVSDASEASPMTVDNGFTELVDVANPDPGTTVGVGFCIAYKTIASAGAVGAVTWLTGSGQGQVMAGFSIQGT